MVKDYKMPVPKRQVTKKADLEFAAELLNQKTDNQLMEFAQEYEGDVRPKFEIYPGE
ncbi:hypothetical protein MFMK1_002011 [Metallumcola ferriviriculae]|uniref:Uncharacterized protein n=1 Tax=Metallumcola ferriviriculae TaxID=3039180 RepID=A0AAU0UPM9_9FIRM|nr:hypothetical protein MFMK1_002011 [Desulfitibacteraceae bacterium MK1]